ncbi:glutathione S-transferase family protein [Rhodoferax sp.]|uniref:glutathione S-transferase family protein n=1 Tax=Rhodoferax sp. TaxID=50421 RepID=UPI0008C781AD|nr:glutathione S-transferase family protein [Rhodoferax sp.]MDO8320730.1 glutathione S-transferase family protein [Rhodoferax sp.]MDP2677629.1 glutathione S-transferase family protein [Rhodoferax sp.]OGB50710.1 MAG: glutathione S-transferase [Burkholderiales bacterium RIFOXYD12_FULL_59_19]OGB73210.1 MAG: glutathione S-transferase [Burkholderiales bacterium RIFOXYC12_FULL_60_6]
MKLYVAQHAPNPRRVTMFMMEKNITNIDLVYVDLNALEHKNEAYRAKSPLATVPALELDDGRVLTETRAICSYLEGLHPEPNLMGLDFEERAFIEMADRRVEWSLLLGIANSVRHTHPGLAVLEQPQFVDFGHAQAKKVIEMAQWFDHVLAQQPWMAGERFSIADITAFCAIEFAKLMKFKPAAYGMPALQAWRDRMAERPSARVR